MTTQNKSVLHHYLGTGLICEFERTVYPKSKQFFELRDSNYSAFASKCYKVKPALYSMKHLTQPLENGEIPLIELAKIGINVKDADFSKSEYKIEKDTIQLIVKHRNFCFYFDEKDSSFGCFFKGNTVNVFNQLECFQYLINNHLNVFNLPESEYIEKSTLKI